MSGLGELFGEAEGRAAAAAGGASLGGDAMGRVHARVRKAHARRSALRASVVAVAVVVVGAGVAYGAGRFGGAEVADSPSPSASPSVSSSPSPSPTPSPTDTGFAWPGFTGWDSVDPHLPEASVITREVWASSGPGWSLISYREAWTSGDREDRGPQVIYLVSPEGERYELVPVPGDTVSVLAWEAGASTAAVSVQPDGDPPYFGMLDLVSGEVTPVDGYAPYIWSHAFLDAGGSPVWTGNDATSAYVSIAPDGTQEAYAIPASDGAAELAEAEIGKPCQVVAPFDDTSVLVSCASNEDDGEIAQVWAGEARVERVSWGDDPEQEASWPERAGDAIVARLGSDCFNALGQQLDGVTSVVPGSGGEVLPAGNYFTLLGAGEGRLVWIVGSGCSGDASPEVVVNSHLASDDYAVLMPYPADRPEGEDPYQSVTGVAVSR